MNEFATDDDLNNKLRVDEKWSDDYHDPVMFEESFKNGSKRKSVKTAF